MSQGSSRTSNALAYGAAVLAAVGGTGLVALLPFTTPPSPDRPTGILFGAGFDDRTSLAAVAHADPRAKLLDIRWHGRLIFVSYAATSFPAALRRAGAVYLFDAAAAGCHTAPPSKGG